MHSILPKGAGRNEDDDVSNAYLPGMYGDWVFSAHHRVRRSLTRRNIQSYARELSKAPGFFFFPRGARERNKKSRREFPRAAGEANRKADERSPAKRGSGTGKSS